MLWKYCKRWVDTLKGELCYYLERYGLKEYGDPVNFGSLDSSPEAIQRDVDYAINNAHFWLNLLPNDGEFLKGKKVLEIGPGLNFGAMLILACHGAEVMVADRFLPPWDPGYHPKFYDLLKKTCANQWPSLGLSPLDIVISQGKYPSKVISLYSCSLEKISVVPDTTLDIVLSNAVLEHIYDLKSAFYHLARITKPGGFGIHMVDFRDHRDFSRPLEYLIMREVKFYGRFKAKQGEIGNRYRPQEMQELLELAGFEVREFVPYIFTDEDYLTEFLERLRQARESRYHDYPAEDLRCLGGRFILARITHEKL